jgi:thymidylate synthase
MSKIDFIYHDLSKAIIDYGYWYKDDSRDKRCKQISSATLSIPLNKFPLLTTKKMFTKGIVGELIWFLRGDSNIKYLNDNGIHIWDDDANNFSDNGNVGRNYGVQWRNWQGIDPVLNEDGFLKAIGIIKTDQIINLITNLKKKPIGRRHIVTAWNPAEIDQTALPPCHWAWEVIPRPLFDFEKKLYPNQEYGFDLKWHQRSVDTFLGLPFNIASYALLAHIIGKLVNFVPLNIIGDLSNVHFYESHIEIVIEQLQRDTNLHEGCDLLFSERFENSIKQYQEGNLILDNFFKELEINDFKFDNYTSFDKLKADMYAPIKE